MAFLMTHMLLCLVAHAGAEGRLLQQPVQQMLSYLPHHEATCCAISGMSTAMKRVGAALYALLQQLIASS